MELRDSLSVLTAPEHIFEALSDADVLGRVLPGCERVIQLGPAEPDGTLHFEARLRLGKPAQPYVAGVALRPAPSGNAATFTLNAHSQHGVARGQGQLTVTPTEDGATLTYSLTLDEVTLPAEQQAALSNGATKEWTTAAARRLVMPRSRPPATAPVAIQTAYGQVVTLPRESNAGKRLIVTSVASLAVAMALLALVISLARRLSARSNTPEMD